MKMKQTNMAYYSIDIPIKAQKWFTLLWWDYILLRNCLKVILKGMKFTNKKILRYRNDNIIWMRNVFQVPQSTLDYV